MIKRSTAVLLSLLCASGVAVAHPGHADAVTAPGTPLHRVLQHAPALGLGAAGAALALLSVRRGERRGARGGGAVARREGGTE